MNRRGIFLLRLQYLSGRIAIFFTAPFLVLLIKLIGYRITDLKKRRRDIAALFNEHPGPWIICANHLTLIDSIILSYAMFPCWRYMSQYQLLPWNLPEKRNFQRNLAITVLCYLLKCIPVVRRGRREAIKNSLSKCEYLLKKGESIMVFPEGTRSRTGRLNRQEFSYGPGRLAGSNPDCRVMCIYLRGDKQKSYGNIPAPNDVFFMSLATCDLKRECTGLKAHRENSRRIIEKLAEMEDAYFDTCGQRHRRSSLPLRNRKEWGPEIRSTGTDG